MAETRWLDEREQRAWRGLLAMHTQLTARMHRDLQADSGLSLADFDVLVQLTDQAEPSLRFGDLAEALQWEKSRLSHHLARMEKRGLVSRKPSKDDARGNIVSLTRLGRTAIEQAAPAHVEKVRHLVFDQLDENQVDTLAAITEAVLARLNAPRAASAERAGHDGTAA
ncbi:MarR family winged helix-turn-helix transcriptional regulator [Halostreptopolyspora alba]|uniref:MarR family transcriptional regulator n=1 Tax=Halostreptopolyspora alba TaxID=2487137 RepID=A0A3N0EHL6_9ACTN|nr:MarR family transcriptional regulator [Nocardiopsaceae bacterium YIM 96095]